MILGLCRLSVYPFWTDVNWCKVLFVGTSDVFTSPLMLVCCAEYLYYWVYPYKDLIFLNNIFRIFFNNILSILFFYSMCSFNFFKYGISLKPTSNFLLTKIRDVSSPDSWWNSTMNEAISLFLMSFCYNGNVMRSLTYVTFRMIVILMTVSGTSLYDVNDIQYLLFPT